MSSLTLNIQTQAPPGKASGAMSSNGGGGQAAPDSPSFRQSMAQQQGAREGEATIERKPPTRPQRQDVADSGTSSPKTEEGATKARGDNTDTDTQVEAAKAEVATSNEPVESPLIEGLGEQAPAGLMPAPLSPPAGPLVKQPAPSVTMNGLTSGAAAGQSLLADASPQSIAPPVLQGEAQAAGSSVQLSGRAHATVSADRVSGPRTVDGGSGDKLAVDITGSGVTPAVKPAINTTQLLRQWRANGATGSTEVPSAVSGGRNPLAVLAEKLGGKPISGFDQALEGALAGVDIPSQAAADKTAGLGGLSSMLTPAGAEMTGARMQVPVNISFGQPQWASMVAERSAWLFSQNITNADLQLDPPELGPLNVQIQVHNHDQASITFVSANPSVRDALDQSSQRLREMLQEQGLDLVNVDVSDQQSSREHAAQQGDTDPHTGARSEGDTAEAESAPVVQMNWNNGIDHYV